MSLHPASLTGRTQNLCRNLGVQGATRSRASLSYLISSLTTSGSASCSGAGRVGAGPAPSDGQLRGPLWGTPRARAEVLILFPGSGNASGGQGAAGERNAGCGQSRAPLTRAGSGRAGPELSATLLT